MGLIYRMHTEADKQALMALWESSSNWGEVGVDSWAYKNLYSSTADVPIIVAEDKKTGSLLGQFAFVPSRISVKGREVVALRPFAPILHHSIRGSMLPTPIIRMYWQAIKELKSLGAGLIYMVPDPRWQGLLERIPGMMIAKFPLWSLPLPLAQPVAMGGAKGCTTTIEAEMAWDARLDELWRSTERCFSVQFIKDRRTLPRRLQGRGIQWTLIQQGDILVGAVASLRKGEGQRLIGDLLMANTADALQATLSAVIRLADEESRMPDPERAVHKIAILATPGLQPTLSQFRFRRDDYDFSFAVQILDPALTTADLHPDQWLVSALD